MNTPATVASDYIDIGVGKVRLKALPMFFLAVMAGAFIALAGAGASTASCSVSVPLLAKLVSACVFPAGLAVGIIYWTCYLRGKKADN